MARKPRREYSDEMKAAVMSALLEGQSVSKVAREYKIPKGTVSGWKHQAEGVAEVPTQKKERIGELLIELVEKNLIALIATADLMADKSWLKQQQAAEIGTLSGITHDKTVRLLEAMGSPDVADDAGEPDSPSRA